MGGITIVTDKKQISRHRHCVEAAHALAEYRGSSQIVEGDDYIIGVQRRHNEALLINDSHSSLAIHGHIAPSSLRELNLSGLNNVKNHLNNQNFKILQKLDGEFSLAYVNKASGVIIFYCSTSATRPLFFSTTGSRFALGTEIRQVLKLTGLSPIINKPAWAQHLAYGHQLLDLESTLYAGVQRAHAGCIHILSTPTGKLERIPYAQDCSIASSLQKDTAGQVLLNAVKTAVDNSLQDAPMGLALSGGLDSSLILSCADDIYKQQPSRGKVFSYSITFPGWEMDEALHIKNCLNTLQRDGKYIDGTRHQPSRYFEQLNAHLDLAPATLTDCYLDILGPAMSQDGCQYRLSGFAGDLTLGSDLFYVADYARQGRIIKALKDAILFQNQDAFSFKKALRRIYHLIMFPKCSNPGRERPNTPSWLHPSQSGIIHDCAVKICAHIREHGLSLGPRLLLLDVLRSGAWSDVVEQRSAQWGMDTLSPLAHQGIVDLTFRMPPDWLDGGRHNRFLIREASQNLVPDACRKYNPKVLHDRFIKSDTNLLAFTGTPQHWRLVHEQLIDAAEITKLVALCKSTGRIDLQLSRILRAEYLARKFD